MGKGNVLLAALNRGKVSRLTLGRDDLEGNRIRYAGEEQTNILPRVLGAASLRPGFAYTGTTRNNAKAYHLPFIFSLTDIAIIELTGQTMRVKVNEAVISRVAVSTAVTSGEFSADTGWTDADEAGSTSTITGGKLNLAGSGFTAAIRKQQVTVAAGDQNKEHALRIVVERGPVTLRVGSTDGGDEYVRETSLGTGTHSLAFTPTGNFWIRLSSLRRYTVIVDSCTVEAAGAMELPTPWVEADMGLIRIDQSKDVIYADCKGYRPRKIERRGSGRSWSVVLFEPEDGPFRVQNTSVTRITPSAINGDITLTASRPLFKDGHVGALFQITSVGQLVQAEITGEGQWSDPIRVTGTGAQRYFGFTISGTWTGTVRLQRSLEEPGAWVDVPGWQWTANSSNPTVFDGLSNEIAYYRIGIKTGEYGSGQANVSLSYASGGITGVARVTAYTSETSVSAIVLKTLGGTTSSSDWREGEWSSLRGWPQAPILDEGRLWHAGYGKLQGSVSDAYESHDPDVEGDSGPINRSIAAGNVDDINWLLALLRLVVGAPAGEFVIRSSSIDEPVSPTLFNIKSPSGRGSAPVAPVKLDSSGIFVGRSGDKLYETSYTVETGDYMTDEGDLMQAVPEIGEPGIVRIALQRNPDTRIHCVRADGKAAVLVKDAAEKVLCWVEIETDGFIEDVIVLPAAGEDSVYYTVRRTVNDNTVRYLERWAKGSECRGGLISKLVDSHTVYDGAATDTLTGLGHLEGREVIVWADGRRIGAFTVTGGAVTLPAAVSKAVVGLYYRGRFKSAKLAYAAMMGTALTQRKKVNQMGLLLVDTHHRGLKYGPNFDDLDDLPQMYQGAPVEEHTIYSDYETDMFEYPGEWGTDPRLCLEMEAPYPCTVLAVVLNITTNDKG